MIHKSASKIGTVRFANGNQTHIWIGSNRNLGTTIVWQRTEYATGVTGRARRTTGLRNLTRLARGAGGVLRPAST